MDGMAGCHNTHEFKGHGLKTDLDRAFGHGLGHEEPIASERMHGLMSSTHGYGGVPAHGAAPRFHGDGCGEGGYEGHGLIWGRSKYDRIGVPPTREGRKATARQAKEDATPRTPKHAQAARAFKAHLKRKFKGRWYQDKVVNAWYKKHDQLARQLHPMDRRVLVRW